MIGITDLGILCATVSYGYNLHGQTTSITGPGFSQRLHYTDGPGKPLYNGSVCAMSWTMGTDATQRGYRYSYNVYNWLTLAEYGDGASLSDHRNRYTESSLEFMLNGGICRLQRHGLKADGVYGKIDNLHIYYDGNLHCHAEGLKYKKSAPNPRPNRRSWIRV